MSMNDRSVYALSLVLWSALVMIYGTLSWVNQYSDSMSGSDTTFFSFASSGVVGLAYPLICMWSARSVSPMMNTTSMLSVPHVVFPPKAGRLSATMRLLPRYSFSEA